MADSSSKPESSDKSGFPKSLKAATSILKSIHSLTPEKIPSTLHTSGSGSSQKSVSISSHKSGANLQTKSSQGNVSEMKLGEKRISAADYGTGKSVPRRMRKTKFMRKYPELFMDDVSINPSYTGLGNFPYNVVCRQRFHKNKSRINRRLNKEIQEITMTQTFALDGVRVGRIFTVGFHPSATIVKDFATPSERRRINEMLKER